MLTFQLGYCALENIFISGTWVRPFESYMSWCEVQSTFTLSNIIVISHCIACMLTTFACHAYIMFQAQNNTCAVNIKHTFMAFIYFVSITFYLFFFFNVSLMFKQVIPQTIYILVFGPLFINIGFLIKERESTFPIIADLIKNPCVSVSTATQELPSMYPDWLEMYPVNE